MKDRKVQRGEMQSGGGDAAILTGQTAREEIWRRHKARLYRYLPTVEQRVPGPLLCIYALINRSYVLDLLPGHSLIEYLLRQGFAVYLLDWDAPTVDDAHLGFEHYILEYIACAVQNMLAHASSTAYSLLGYCMGGTMSAIYATLASDAALKNLLLLATPIDFAAAHTGLYGTCLSQESFTLDTLLASYPIIPGELITLGNLIIKAAMPHDESHPTEGEHAYRGGSPQVWRAIQQWNYDGIPFAGTAFKQWICDFYQQNKLSKGELSLDGQRVELSRITCSLLSIAGTRDRLCTPAQAEAIMHHSSSQDKTFWEFDTGHVGLLTSPQARQEIYPRLCAWLAERSLRQ